MSFLNCIRNAAKNGVYKGGQGSKAEKIHADLKARHMAGGMTDANADALAAQQTAAFIAREAREQQHVLIARVNNNRKLAADVAAAGNLKKHQTRKVEELDYKARGLVRRFNARLGAFLREHHRDILGNVTKPAQMKNFVREMHGEATGDASAQALAQGVQAALEDMRLMFNEAGGLIGKLDTFGIPHSHNRRAITKAGFDAWYQDIAPKLDWTKIDDYQTLLPFDNGSGPPPEAVQRAFLQEVYDNIAYGKGSKVAQYGASKGQALYKSRSESRILHFKGADDWIAYNKRFGSGDAFKSLMGHVHKMARDIAAVREFGPNPGLGRDYMEQLAVKRAREQGIDPDAVIGNGKHAARMFEVERGGVGPETLWQDYVSTFMSSARHVMTSAFLDRAIIASVSDMNSMRMAAKAMGLNGNNVLAEHVRIMKDMMTKPDALRQHWIADTLADPGVAVARFQAEVPPAEIAERLSSASMRIQGLSGWTDAARMAFQWSIHGEMAALAGQPLSQITHPLGKFLRDAGITDAEWADLTAHQFTAGNGATFVDPLWWREQTSLSAKEADDLFDKVQGMIEEQTEYAVPTQSLLARGMVDPSAFDLPPGSLGYEVLKSGLMFKSFTMAFSVNQIRRIMAQPTREAKFLYGIELVGGMTVLGALALQIGEIVKGNDPRDMTTPDFWALSMMKGGGLAILGDIIQTGSASWGGGFASYVAGPVPQVMDEAWDLTVMNAWEFATGEKTNFAKELAKAGKRYTPMGQTPVLGPALDRLLWDQMQLFLDPSSSSAMKKSATARQNRDGNASFWAPGSPVPTRAPDLSAIFGL